MAAPAVVGKPVETAISTAATSHVVSLPAANTNGNMLVAICSKGSQGTTPSVNALGGWQELLDEAIVLGLYVAYRIVNGTEGATETFTMSSATRGAWIVYEISGMREDFATQPPEIGTTATGSSTTPDPPSRAVNGGPKDILTIALFGRSGEEADDDTWVTAAPSGFTGLIQKACGTAGTNLGGMLATASATANTSTSNPGTFTCATGAWRANTIVFHPAAPTHLLSVPMDLGLSIVTALARETFLSAAAPFGPQIDTALLRQTFISATTDLGLSIVSNLDRILLLSVAFDLGLSIVSNLDEPAPPGFVEHFISADFSLGFSVTTALLRETFISATTPLDLQIATNLLRELLLQVDANYGPQIATALLRQTFLSVPDDLGLLITSNLIVEGQGGDSTINRLLLGAG
jgi:hypothetical protein